MISDVVCFREEHLLSFLLRNIPTFVVRPFSQQLNEFAGSWKKGACTFLLASSLASLFVHSSLHDGTASTGEVGMTSTETPGSTRFLGRSELWGFCPLWFQRAGSLSPSLNNCSSQYAHTGIQKGHTIFEVPVSLDFNLWTLGFSLGR